MALRLGCDLCQIGEMSHILEAGGAPLERLFSHGERTYALAQKRPEQHLAGFFAAKEALAKAIRDSSVLGNYHCEVTISHHEDGVPYLQVSDPLGEVLTRRRIEILDLSISHDGEYAIATVLVQCEDETTETLKSLQCYRCLITLDSLIEQRIADVLFAVRSSDGLTRYLCPACARGW